MSFSVSSIGNTVSRTPDMSLSLKKAIKDYQDELYTGLTEDERKEIEAKINEFVKERSKDKNYDKDAFKAELDAFIKGLLKEYGFKGGDTFSDILDSNSKGGSVEEPLNTNTISTANAAADILMNVQTPKTGTNEGITAKSDITVDSDGSSHLIISTPNGLFMRIKMETAQAIQDTSPKANNAVSDYEKNIEDYFDEKNIVSFSS